MRKKVELFVNTYLMFCIYALIGWLYEVLWMKFVVAPHKWINRGVLLGPFLPIYGFGMLLLYFILKSAMKKSHPIKDGITRNIAAITLITFIYTTIIEYTTPKIYQVSAFLKEYGVGLIIANITGLIIINFISKNKKIKEIDLTIVLVFLAIWFIATTLEYISHFVMDKYFHVMLWDYTKDFLNVNKRINWDASRNFAIGGTFLLYTVQPLINKYFSKVSQKRKYIITFLIGIPMIVDFIFHVLLKMI